MNGNYWQNALQMILPYFWWLDVNDDAVESVDGFESTGVWKGVWEIGIVVRAAPEQYSIEGFTADGKFEFNEGDLEPIDADQSIAWQDWIS